MVIARRVDAGGLRLVPRMFAIVEAGVRLLVQDGEL